MLARELDPLLPSRRREHLAAELLEVVRDEQARAREVRSMKTYEGPTYAFVALNQCGREDVGGGEAVLLPAEKVELATFPVVRSVRLDGQP